MAAGVSAVQASHSVVVNEDEPADADLDGVPDAIDPDDDNDGLDDWLEINVYAPTRSKAIPMVMGSMMVWRSNSG